LFSLRSEAQRTEAYAFASSLAAPCWTAFEHPAGGSPIVLDVRTIEFPPCHNGFSQTVRKEFTLQTFGQDKYGRTLTDVILGDGTNVNQELVNQGWCWWYQKYAPGDTVLEGLGKDAREARIGLWVGTSA
jgi:hypothetical protein